MDCTIIYQSTGIKVELHISNEELQEMPTKVAKKVSDKMQEELFACLANDYWEKLQNICSNQFKVEG